MVQGLQEPPCRADALALRRSRRRDADGLRAALPRRAPGPAAKRRRPRPRLRALLRPGRGQGLFRRGRALRPPQGRRLWDAITDELVEVEWSGGRGWIADRDRKAPRFAAAGLGDAADPAAGPLPAAGRPRDSRRRRRGSQAPLPRRRQPRRGAPRRRPRRDLEGAGAVATGPRSRSSVWRRSTATSSSASARGSRRSAAPTASSSRSPERASSRARRRRGPRRPTSRAPRASGCRACGRRGRGGSRSSSGSGRARRRPRGWSDRGRRPAPPGSPVR